MRNSDESVWEKRVTTVKRMNLQEFEGRLLDSSGLEDAPPGSSGEPQLPYAVELDELYFLYCTVRDTAAVSILEFGSGWSTLALAIALEENRRMMASRYSVRHPNPFSLMSIDASREWMAVTLSRIPKDILGRVVPHVATPKLREYRGQLVSMFDSLPFFVPDIVYLDGPDPDQVEGEVDGFESTGVHVLPMAADLLRLEPQLWPWTTVITDGRRGNARLLETNFRRSWQIMHDPFGDHSVFRLDETPFGPVSSAHIAARLETARTLRMKEPPVAG